MEKRKQMKRQRITLTFEQLKKLVDEDSSMENGVSHNDELLLEMATIGWPTIDKVKYKLSIHGINTKDRPIPHIHLDRADDLERNSFKFEISLIDMLKTGEPVLVLQKDLKKHINRTNRTECNWNGYKKLHDGVVAYLESNPEPTAPNSSRSNLESFIIAWNNESGDNPNRLAEYIKNEGIEVLDKYKLYFPTLYPERPAKKSVVKSQHGKR